MRKLIHVSETVITGPTGRTQLSRDAIVRAAVDVIERDGEDAVSMRRIATELSCGVMSLYNHVPNKEALLDAVAEHVMAGYDFTVRADLDWRDRARALVHTFRAMARRYPRCLNVVVTRQLDTPSGLQPIEAALATARAAGFEGLQAVRIMRAFVGYVQGSLLHENQMQRARERDHPNPVDGQRFPNITELGGDLLEADYDEDFEFGVELLISAVAARRPGPR
jgi:AcrR family transcriptional regulator